MMILFALSRFLTRQLMELADSLFEMKPFGPAIVPAHIYIREK
jgi:hypothetical protein